MNIINPFPKYTEGKLIFDDGRQLLREFYSIPTDTISKIKEDSRLITESINKGELNHDNLIMNCILQKCEIENKNSRWYPRNILERENNNYQQLIKEGRALSHSSHPDHSLVEFKDSSHRIIKTWWDENTLMGQIEILASPGFYKMGICSVPGDIIAYFLGKGVKMGISSRGVGSLKEINGKNVVQDDFELIAFDLVSSPSTPGAFLFDDNREMAENIQEGLKNKIISKELIDPFINNLDEFLKL